MTFDIIVFEEDELPDGSLGMKQHAENGVQASSRKELVGLYAMLGQKIKILREYGGQSQQGPISATPQNITSSDVQAMPVAKPRQPAAHQPASQSKAAPQFYKIGDVEIKIEDGVSYQKQFLRLTDAEASNIRIVDDKTNKVVNLKNKHIEMKRWVKVETSAEDTTSALEESLA